MADSQLPQVKSIFNFNTGDVIMELEKAVVLKGVVYNLRQTKWGGFIQLRSNGKLIQLVVNDETVSILKESGEKIHLKDVSRETSVIVEGTVTKASIKDNTVYYKDREVEVAKMQVLSCPETNNLIDPISLSKEVNENLTYRLDHRHVTLRNIRDISIFKVESMVSNLFASYCVSQGLVQIFSPKIVSAGAEGGANIFSLDYFGKPVYLAQSPQFYKQICVGVFDRVFEIAPVYRAEKSNTSRHLSEYISMDVELGFIESFMDVMDFEIGLLRYILANLAEKCSYELEILNVSLPQLPEKVPTFRISEIHEIVFENYGKDHIGEPDLSPEEEKFICDYCLECYESDFVFATHFPSAHRAFYTMDAPENAELSLSYDLLMRGKEITSGGQRIHKRSEYEKKMLRLGMNLENFQFYLEAFEQGMPPHGGFGMGIERLTGGILGIFNTKEASLFPRDVNRIYP
jgi:nondiscriminating aspartyl-tRNA synthetase